MGGEQPSTAATVRCWSAVLGRNEGGQPFAGAAKFDYYRALLAMCRTCADDSFENALHAANFTAYDPLSIFGRHQAPVCAQKFAVGSFFELCGDGSVRTLGEGEK